MEKWDVHTHTTLSPDTFAALEKYAHYADFIRVRKHASKPCCAVMVNARGDVQREVEENAYDGAARIRDCDRYGVTVQVLSPTPMMIPDYVDNGDDAEDICRVLNDDNAATMARFPDRFRALAALPMAFPDRAIREMERVRRDHGMPGIEINSNIDGRDLDDDALFPVFEAAERLGMAVFIHPWGGFMAPADPKLKPRMNLNRNWRPWLIGMGMETAIAFDSMRSGRVHERLPGLRVMYAHGGGAFPALLGRLEHGAYCRPDLFKDPQQLNPFDVVRKCGVYADTLVHNPAMLKALIEILGVERVAMGSDYPYPLGEMDCFDPVTRTNLYGYACPYPEPKGVYPGYDVERLAISKEDKLRLLSGTAKEWLGSA
ncbi:MAG TPA: amidohydrolase family protein [Patescibacteria group bacterium]|nr:amidohydrolase family protein [Patescibacteria group bacterium]